MKKNSFIFAICIMVVFIANVAGATSKEYLSISSGIVTPNDSEADIGLGDSVDLEFKEGFNIAAAIGSYFDNNFRCEAEIFYQEFSLDHGKWRESVIMKSHFDVSIIGIFGNVYYDFVNRSPFTPFLSAGIGLSGILLSTERYPYGYRLQDDHEIAPICQLGTGVGFAINSSMNIDFVYRYFATDDLTFESEDPDRGAASAELSSHNFFIGLRTLF